MVGGLFCFSPRFNIGKSTNTGYSFFFFFFFFFFSHFYFPASGQAVVTGVVPSPARFLPSIFIAHRRVQQSHCSSIFHRVLLTHALALSASQFVHKKKSQRIYTNMHSAGLELTKLTCARLEDNLIRHRGDRYVQHCSKQKRAVNEVIGLESNRKFSRPEHRHRDSNEVSVPLPRDSIQLHSTCRLCIITGIWHMYTHAHI